jgi:hypothetical protein
MNSQKYHLFDATVDLFDLSEINCDSGNSDVRALIVRVILAVRAYPSTPPLSSPILADCAQATGAVSFRLSFSKGEGRGEGFPAEFTAFPIPHLHPLPFFERERRPINVSTKISPIAALTAKVISERTAGEY